MRQLSLFFVVLLLFVSSPAAWGAYSQSLTLEPVSREVAVEGKGVQVAFYPHVSLSTEGKQIRGDIAIEADMGGVQHRLVEVLGGSQRFDECGQRVAVTNVRIIPKKGALSVAGTVHLEQWACLFGKKPRKLVSKSFDVAALGIPRVVEGDRVEIDVEVTQAAPKGVLGVVAQVFNLEEVITRKVKQAIADAAPDGLSAMLPPQVKQHGVSLTQVSFTDRGEGRLGLMVEGQVQMPLSAMSQLLLL